MRFHGDESSMGTPLCDRATLPHFDRADPTLRPLGMGGRGSEANSSTSSFLPEGFGSKRGSRGRVGRGSRGQSGALPWTIARLPSEAAHSCINAKSNAQQSPPARTPQIASKRPKTTERLLRHSKMAQEASQAAQETPTTPPYEPWKAKIIELHRGPVAPNSFGTSWGSLGALLGLSWSFPGALLGLSWDPLGALLGPSWGLWIREAVWGPQRVFFS